MAPGTIQSVDIPAANTLEIEARIDWPQAAGGAECMKVTVNGPVLDQAPSNRALTTSWATGGPAALFNRTTLCWSVPYSPDFVTNNVGGPYMITSDPGQAYRFFWPLNFDQKGGSVLQVKIENTGQGTIQAPLVVRIYNP